MQGTVPDFASETTSCRKRRVGNIAWDSPSVLAGFSYWSWDWEHKCPYQGNCMVPRTTSIHTFVN